MSDLVVREYVSGPGSYEDKTYSLDEIREIFSPGDLPYVMADEIERLRADNERMLILMKQSYEEGCHCPFCDYVRAREALGDE